MSAGEQVSLDSIDKDQIKTVGRMQWVCLNVF